MAGVLALRVVAGLAAAALAALLLEHYGLAGPPSPLPKPRDAQRPHPAPGSGAHNVFWGLQISDIHLSRFQDPGRALDLEKFCSETVDTIQPALVLATDAYNIPSLESITNYYRKYSAVRKDGSFHYVHSTPFGNYSFISVDATQKPGPKRPYNFFGILDEKQMEELLSFSKKSSQSNQTIWFGHFTTSTILSPSPGIRTVMSSATAYMCGHLHTLGGLMPVLHTRHFTGTLELEVGDWKDNRSFADVTFDKWPVVLITNPKSLLYSCAKHEPLERLFHSTHIRVLAFSLSPITSVAVKIDGVNVGQAAHLSGPIFILKWNPKNYSNGTHTIEVSVQDSAGRSRSAHHIFSAQENTHLTFDPLASFILLTDHYIVVVFFNIPLMAYICWSLLQRSFGHNFRSHLHQGKHLKIIPVHLLILLLYIWQVYSCYFLHVTYGTLAFFFSPLRTWLTLLTPVLIRCVWTLNATELGTFMVQLKSRGFQLAAWQKSSLHICSPDLCPSGRWKASVSGRQRALIKEIPK
ncbi:hypothetical protein A6R68_08480, partial [Neotoma lepida]